MGDDRRRRVADVDQPSVLVFARAVNVLGAVGPLASSNASPVGSCQMIASYPRDPVIALVGEGFGSLLVHGTARHLGLENREITILGTKDDPVLSPTPGAVRIG